jgi:2-oxoglutarate dehydrogenase E1 component
LSQFHTLASSSEYLEALLARYRSDPAGVPQDWRAAFEILAGYFPGAVSPGTEVGSSAHDLVRRFAHLTAKLDPLERALPKRWHRLRTEFERRLARMGADPAAPALAKLLQVYAGPLALETGHLDDPARVAWIESRLENLAAHENATRSRALATVVKAETFERFMATRFPGKKRFGAEGAESLYALIQRVLDRAAAAGVREVVVGTMHRGRLGLMSHAFGQPLQMLFARMKGAYPLSEVGRAADVPYHLGFLGEHVTPAGRVTIRLLPNPSHLEAINAVALGYARSRQETLGSSARVLPLILHTDASVVAQGVVSEALQFSEISGYQVGGAINVVVNNQVGFTTEPGEGRSSRYCTAAWKTIDSLISHVNGDDVDAVLAAADLAFDYREHFRGESVVDLVCIRANGHNEIDEPRFTQPQYYELAGAKTRISARYALALLGDRIVEPEFVEQVADSYRAELESAHQSAGDAVGPIPDQAALAVPSDPGERSASLATPMPLEAIAELAAQVPEEGQFNPKVVRLTTARRLEWHTTVSWATAELLALGVILSTGWNVRFTGQDVDRGAFSQRHLSMKDAASGRRHQVFESSPDAWGALEIHNSPLSEYAALSYEYGYAVAAPRTLDIWEAQFGDFANGAQIVFDQFICSGEEKWQQRCGLVVLLPHGLEGQGPEHSSARIERLLQLAARDNLRIAQPSTPANYFHLLVSQIAVTPPRPLIVLTPKKLLRLKEAISPPVVLESGRFEPIIVRPASAPARRVLVCSGKIYYDLVEGLGGGTDSSGVTIIRLEQLYPFPRAELIEALRSASAADVVWVQEEPVNFGSWGWLRSHFEAAIASAGGAPVALTVVARPASPSPAGSFHTEHDADQRKLVATALACPPLPTSFQEHPSR